MLRTPRNGLSGWGIEKSLDLYGTTKSGPKQGFVLFESVYANEISLVDSYDEGSVQVLHRPIEITRLFRSWPWASAPNGSEKGILGSISM
jgi:hypothetical protein